MIPLAWPLFWLWFYLHISITAPVVSGALPEGTLGWATWCGGCPRERISVDLVQIDSRKGYGPWDKVVFTACTLVHEQAHIDTQSANHYAPYTSELDCLSRFYAITPTPAIRQMMIWPRSELAEMPKNNLQESE